MKSCIWKRYHLVCFSGSNVYVKSKNSEQGCVFLWWEIFVPPPQSQSNQTNLPNVPLFHHSLHFKMSDLTPHSKHSLKICLNVWLILQVRLFLNKEYKRPLYSSIFPPCLLVFLSPFFPSTGKLSTTSTRPRSVCLDRFTDFGNLLGALCGTFLRCFLLGSETKQTRMGWKGYS